MAHNNPNVKLQKERCAHCGTMFAGSLWDMAGLENRYRWPDYTRLLSNQSIVRTIRYHYESQGNPRSYSVEMEDFDKEFGEWLDWTPDKDGSFESRQNSDDCWSSRRLVSWYKLAELSCGCQAEFELERDPSAKEKCFHRLSSGCTAHSGGWQAFDSKGRCYVCDWPVTPYAKGYSRKAWEREPTYQAIPLINEQLAA